MNSLGWPPIRAVGDLRSPKLLPIKSHVMYNRGLIHSSSSNEPRCLGQKYKIPTPISAYHTDLIRVPDLAKRTG